MSIMRIEKILYLSELFHNVLTRRVGMNVGKNKIAPYSTAVPKCCIDIVDVFTDILLFNREKSKLQLTNEVMEPATKEFVKKNINEELFRNINFADEIKARTALDKILQENILNQNWSTVTHVVEVYTKEEIAMDHNTMQSLVELFSNSGFLRGLLQLRLLMCKTNPNSYLKEGELLIQLARCYWVAGNSKECFVRMNEFFIKYPNLKDSLKTSFRRIIYEAVAKRSEAELKCTVLFVEQYTKQRNDFYFMAILWNYLFLSKWFTDHNLADELLQRYEVLRTIISLMASSLVRYLIRCSQINDVYRLLQSFLKYEMMDSYAIGSQILFDYFCRKGDQYACSEIIKTSVRLKSPLREEQYNYFISWCATGDPFKCTPATEIKKMYSDF